MQQETVSIPKTEEEGSAFRISPLINAETYRLLRIQSAIKNVPYGAIIDSWAEQFSNSEATTHAA
jgi:hypothetical protein